MSPNRFHVPILGTILIPLAAGNALAAIEATGSCWPNPLHGGDGVVTSQLQIGVSFNSEGSVTVTEGDIMTTERGTYLGYMTGATGSVTVTDSIWNAESAVFIAPQFSTEGTVHLINSLWIVESNIALAQGDGSHATVTLEGDSEWRVQFGVTIASGEACVGEVNVNNGAWTAQAGVTVGGSGFVGSDGEGTINIKAGGVMNSKYGLDITSFGSLELDGGMLSLAGESDFEGTVIATTNGGLIEIKAGQVDGGIGLVRVGSGVNFTNCDIEIVLHPNALQEPAGSLDLFDTIGDVDLATVLAMADLITTPLSWILDFDTGVLSFVSIPLCVEGPDLEASQTCRTVHDYDADSDVDLADFATYQRVFGD